MRNRTEKKYENSPIFCAARPAISTVIQKKGGMGGNAQSQRNKRDAVRQLRKLVQSPSKNLRASTNRGEERERYKQEKGWGDRRKDRWTSKVIGKMKGPLKKCRPIEQPAYRRERALEKIRKAVKKGEWR